MARPKEDITKMEYICNAFNELKQAGLSYEEIKEVLAEQLFYTPYYMNRKITAAFARTGIPKAKRAKANMWQVSI